LRRHQLLHWRVVDCAAEFSGDVKFGVRMHTHFKTTFEGCAAVGRQSHQRLLLFVLNDAPSLLSLGKLAPLLRLCVDALGD